MTDAKLNMRHFVSADNMTFVMRSHFYLKKMHQRQCLIMTFF